MQSLRHRQITIGLVLVAACLGLGLYLIGLAITLKIGDSSATGFLLIPDLPTPMYIIMLFVLLACVSITLLNSFLRRRESKEPQHKQLSEAIRQPPYLSVIVSLLMAAILIWLFRTDSPLQDWLQLWRVELAALRGSFSTDPHTLIEQVHSPIAGYALFIIVIVMYGGLALLGLWTLLDRPRHFGNTLEEESIQSRRVQRALLAGLHALQQYDDPRQAIIACYSQLEHLLADHGIPADETLTPQEHMGAALQGIDIPLNAFSGLVELFELARYSLHPLDERAKQTATTHLKTIQAHLQLETALEIHT